MEKGDMVLCLHHLQKNYDINKRFFNKARKIAKVENGLFLVENTGYYKESELILESDVLKVGDLVKCKIKDKGDIFYFNGIKRIDNINTIFNLYIIGKFVYSFDQVEVVLLENIYEKQ